MTSETSLNIKRNSKFSEKLLTSMTWIKKDTIGVSFSNVGLGGTALKIIFSESIEPKLVLWSDENEFDDKHEIELDLDYFSIDINKANLKRGDTLMGKMYLKSKPSKFIIGSGILEMKGDLFAVIGKIVFIRQDGKVIILDNEDL
jgi:hypothetical protein